MPLFILALLQLLHKLAFCCKGHKNFVVTASSSPQHLREREQCREAPFPGSVSPSAEHFCFPGLSQACCWQAVSWAGRRAGRAVLQLTPLQAGRVFLISTGCLREASPEPSEDHAERESSRVPFTDSLLFCFIYQSVQEGSRGTAQPRQGSGSSWY